MYLFTERLMFLMADLVRFVLKSMPDPSPKLPTNSSSPESTVVSLRQIETFTTQQHHSVQSQTSIVFVDYDIIEGQIRWLLIRLKLHISEVRFMKNSFKKEQRTYREEIKTIESSIEYLTDSAIEIVPNMFAFAKYMYHEMRDATTVLDAYSSVLGVERYYICGVTHLHIWLFILHDSVGYINLRDNLYESKIIQSWQKLCIWTAEFEEVLGVPVEHRAAFEKQRRKADEAIDRLWSQIPDNRKVYS